MFNPLRKVHRRLDSAEEKIERLEKDFEKAEALFKRVQCAKEKICSLGQSGILYNSKEAQDATE